MQLCTCVQDSLCPLFCHQSDAAGGTYQFENIHFQEYLCACYIVHATPNLSNLAEFAQVAMQDERVAFRHMAVVWMIRELVTDDVGRQEIVANQFLPGAQTGTLHVHGGVSEGKSAVTFFSLVSALAHKVAIDMSQSDLFLNFLQQKNV